MKYFLGFLFLINFGLLSAQEIEFSPEFSALCDQIGIDVFTPAESGFKSVKVAKNPYQDYQAAIRSRRENLEIRYAFVSYNEVNLTTTMPHLQVTRSVASAATNEEDAIIAFHEIAPKDLQMFGADWGQMVIFRPKEGFSNQPFCKMLTLFKEGHGTASVFYLFDDADNSAVDDLYFSMQFFE